MKHLKSGDNCCAQSNNYKISIDIKEPPAIKQDYSTKSDEQVASSSDKTEFVIKSEDNNNNREWTDTSDTDVVIKFEPLHTDMALKPEPLDTDVDVKSEPLDTDVDVKFDPLKTEPLDTDVDVKSEYLDIYVDVKSEPIDTDVDVKFDPLKPEPLDTDVDVKSETLDIYVDVKFEPLKPEPLDTDVDVKSEPLDIYVDVKSEPLDIFVDVKSEPLKPEPVDTDVDVRSELLKPEPLDTDVDVKSELLKPEPLDTDVDVKSDPLDIYVNVKCESLKPEPLDTNVDVKFEPLDTDLDVQSEPLKLEPLDTDVDVNFEPLDTDVDVQSEPLKPEPLDSDVDIKYEPLAIYTEHQTTLENDSAATLRSNSKKKTSTNTNPTLNNGNNSDHMNVLDGSEYSKKNTNKRQLFTHQKHVHIDKKKPFECKISYERFVSSTDLDRHVHIFNHEELHGSDISCVDKGHQTVKRKSRTQPHICIICWKPSASAKKLIAHRNTHNGDTSFSCLVCHKRFDHQRLLEGHIRRFHMNRFDEYKCYVYSKQFKSKHHVWEHESVHIDEKLFECDVCHKRFRKSDVLDSHLHLTKNVDVQRLRDQRIECCISDVQFATSLEYASERLDVQRRICDEHIERCISDVQFATSERLDVQRRIRDQHIACCISNVQFATSERLDVQRRIRDQHIESCISDVQFATSERLDVQRRIRDQHIECCISDMTCTDKSYECDICHERFLLGSHLDGHIRSHVDSGHVCRICNKQFLSRLGLKRHKSIHLRRSTSPQLHKKQNKCDISHDIVVDIDMADNSDPLFIDAVVKSETVELDERHTLATLENNKTSILRTYIESKSSTKTNHTLTKRETW